MRVSDRYGGSDILWLAAAEDVEAERRHHTGPIGQGYVESQRATDCEVATNPSANPACAMVGTSTVFTHPGSG